MDGIRPLIISNPKISTPLGNDGRKILADAQLLQPHLIFQRETFLVSQMQQADEAVRGGDVGHGLFGIDVLEIVHDGGEL